jgi:regulatory protein
LAQVRDEMAEPDLAAALTFARRRRLGPYRSAANRVEHRERDLAALGRQGFPYEVARRVIEADDAAALEDEIAEL